MTDPRAAHHPTTAWVSLDRILENFRALRTYAGGRAIIPVIKADAYGHGALPVARLLEPLGVPMFAVAYVKEAIALREAGIKAPLLVLTGFVPGQLDDLLRFDLTPVVSTPEQVIAIESLRADEEPQGFAVHVKVDTGMHRLGFSLHELEPVIHRLEEAEGVRVEGLMTHLASADEDASATARQLDAFDEAIVRLQTLGIRPRLIHAANSAGMAWMRESHTAVRPGLLLYGLSPRPLSPDVDVRPALQIRARVALVKTVATGTPVSYGGRFVAKRVSRIATINAGYADGIPRTELMRKQGRMGYRSEGLPLAGTVCMDLTALDATDTPDLAVGDEVTVLGENPSAWDLADWAGTTAWQILTGVGSRATRRYVLDNAVVDEHPAPPESQT